jgi:hypothetical protein
VFTYDDIVRVKASSPTSRPGARAWVIGVFSPEERLRLPLRQFPPGTVYSVKFEDGKAMDIHEDNLELDGEPPLTWR